jgi:hypothetical protein
MPIQNSSPSFIDAQGFAKQRKNGKLRMRSFAQEREELYASDQEILKAISRVNFELEGEIVETFRWSNSKVAIPPRLDLLLHRSCKLTSVISKQSSHQQLSVPWKLLL